MTLPKLTTWGAASPASVVAETIRRVAVGARTRIEQRTHVGIGATSMSNLRVGEGAYVGAGAVVVRDVRPGVPAYGVPARERRKLDP